jgi:hypothetical protein
MISGLKTAAALFAVTLILALIFSMPAYAQKQRSSEGAPDQEIGREPQAGMNLDKHLSILRERLKLSDSQVTSVRGILEEHQKIADAERDKNRGNRDEAMKAAEKRRQETDVKIKAVLNEEQKKEYEKVKDEIRKEVMKNRKDRQERPGGGRPGRRGRR